jgi:hypothetical protein
MLLLLAAKSIAREAVFPRKKDHILHFGIYEQVSIFGADGAVAAYHVVAANIRQCDGESDRAAMAIT